MANFFPCPNAGCSYQFDADQLPPAAMVTCPLCRTRFPYRASERAAVATAPPETEQDSDDNPYREDREDREDRPRTSRLVNPRHVPQSSPAKMYLGIAGLVVVLMAVGFVMVRMMKKPPLQATSTTQDGKHVDDTFNFSFQVPEGWVRDDTLRNNMQVNSFAYKRPDGSAFIALRTMDFKNRDGLPRNPRPAEMIDEMNKIFRRTFGSQPAMQPTDGGKLGGRAARGNFFQAEQGEQQIAGEVFLMDYKGVAYLFFAWAPAEKWDSVHGEIRKARDQFELGKLRENWKGNTASIDFFEAGGHYQLTDHEGVWETSIPTPKEGDPKTKKLPRNAFIADPADHDPTCTILLRARVLIGDSRDHNPEAWGYVYVHEKFTGEPIDAAKAFVKSRWEKPEVSGIGKASFEDVVKSPTGATVPETSISVVRFLYRNSEDKTAKKLVVVAAMKLEEKLVFAELWCKDIDMDKMEQHMLNLAATLRERK